MLALYLGLYPGVFIMLCVYRNLASLKRVSFSCNNIFVFHLDKRWKRLCNVLGNDFILDIVSKSFTNACCKSCYIIRVVFLNRFPLLLYSLKIYPTTLCGLLDFELCKFYLIKVESDTFSFVLPKLLKRLKWCPSYGLKSFVNIEVNFFAIMTCQGYLLVYVWYIQYHWQQGYVMKVFLNFIPDCYLLTGSA